MALLFDSECRWLTITGPGGVGKTRLAMAAAASLAPRLRHGVLWFSGRDAGGALRDAETLVQQVLECVGTDRQEPGALLLVLDNLETVAGVRSWPGVLAERVPGAFVLATSRTRLGGVSGRLSGCRRYRRQRSCSPRTCADWCPASWLAPRPTQWSASARALEVCRWRWRWPRTLSTKRA